MNTFAERLKWAREKQHIPCTTLDEKAGLSTGHVALIESGVREHPSTETASKIAKALGVSVAWLIDGGKRPQIAASK